MPININVCGTPSQGPPSAHSHLLTLAAQGRGSCVVSLTVHTKRPLFLCPEHLQFPSKELHRLLDTLALSHRHLGHTGKQNKSAMSRAHVLWLSHSFQTGHSPTALGITLDNINSDPCPSNLRRGPQSARIPLRGRARVSSVSHVDIKLSTTSPGKTRVPTFCEDSRWYALHTSSIIELFNECDGVCCQPERIYNHWLLVGDGVSQPRSPS